MTYVLFVLSRHSSAVQFTNSTLNAVLVTTHQQLVPAGRRPQAAGCSLLPGQWSLAVSCGLSPVSYE